MSMRNLLGLTLALSLAVAAGCKSYEPSAEHGRVDPDRDDVLGGTGTESGDIRAMSDQFARSILGNPIIANAKTPPTIAVTPFHNRIDDIAIRGNADIIHDRVVSLLMQQSQGKLLFLERSRMDDIRDERGAMQRGEVTSAQPKDVLGADYFLTGDVKAVSKTNSEGKSTYLVYTYKLVDTQSSALIWQDFYEQKRVARRGAVYK